MDRIVFFDGECVLCNGFVDFLIQHQRAQKRPILRLASLQSEAAKRLLGPLADDLKSVVLWQKNGAEAPQISEQSAAIFQILRVLSFPWFSPWRWIQIFRWLPRPFCDFFYSWIAKNRYAWFGKRDSCRLPTSEEKLFFYEG
jgi:predicted DCC family thiol-disulfide oxidoreductase YuxK